MVKSTLAKVEQFEQEIAIEDTENDIKWCTVSLLDVVEHGKRLEASVFDVEAKNAREIIDKSKWKKTNLKEGNIIKEAFYPGRFKRIYVDKQNGIPFYLPSQINDVYPKAEKYISNITDCDIEKLKVKKGDILLTRSGTIGNVTIVSETLENKVFSDDVIRIKLNNEYDVGYLYTYLKTKIGKKILQTNKYGSVITHIEPEHLEGIIIPNANKAIKEEINRLIRESFKKRDESNNLIDNAERILLEELKIESIEKFTNKEEIYTQTFNIKLSNINNRLDASYHIPIVDEILEKIKQNSEKIIRLGEKEVTKNVILAGVFKRVYVGENEGIPFLGGKEIIQLSPEVEKYLSRPIHFKRYEKELKIKENMLLVTDRGTVGTATLVPKHFENWAVSQNVLKIEASDNNIAGYLYVFLNTEVGKILIRREIYGSVIDMIDDKSISNVQIPLLKDKYKQESINQLALKANKLRYEAYCLEQEAIQIMNKEVIYAK